MAWYYKSQHLRWLSADDTIGTVGDMATIADANHWPIVLRIGLAVGGYLAIRVISHRAVGLFAEVRARASSMMPGACYGYFFSHGSWER